jgi:plasmid stabilization system protein ParE
VPRVRRLLLSPEACRDLDLIDEPLRGDVLERLRLLERFPHSGAPFRARVPGLRSSTVKLFRIFYQVTDLGVDVIYIRHCKRRIPDFAKK